MQRPKTRQRPLPLPLSIPLSRFTQSKCPNRSSSPQPLFIFVPNLLRWSHLYLKDNTRASPKPQKPPSMVFIRALILFFFFLSCSDIKQLRISKPCLPVLLIWWSYLLGKRIWFHVCCISIISMEYNEWVRCQLFYVVWDGPHKWVGFFLINRVWYFFFSSMFVVTIFSDTRF